jgi:hypothetical protein
MNCIVAMLQALSNCFVISREWCSPSTTLTVGLLFWCASDAVSDVIAYVQSIDKVTIPIDPSTDNYMTEITSNLHKRDSLWDMSYTMSDFAYIIFRSVSNAAPAPQDMLAGVGRLAGRPINSEISTTDSNLSFADSSGIFYWRSIAHTITGLNSLIRGALLNATGDKIVLPRHNEWLTAVAESLLFCIENGYKSRMLILLTPMLSELLLELSMRQSDSSLAVDEIFSELSVV